MYGAILGDMIGSPYEFDQGDKTKDFELFDKRKRIRYTDDSAMTIAIAKAIMTAGLDADESAMKREFVAVMQNFRCLSQLRGLSGEDVYSVFEAITRMANICGKVDSSITPYKVDKVFWLICSGRFYLEKPNEIHVRGKKKELIEYLKAI